MPKIRFIFLTTSSRRDLNGNRYHILSMVNTQTGIAVEALYGSEHPSAITRQLGLEYNEVFCASNEIGIKAFNRIAKSLPHYLPNDFIEKMNELNS